MGMFCGNCGAQLNPGINFCGACGKAVAAPLRAGPPFRQAGKTRSQKRMARGVQVFANQDGAGYLFSDNEDIKHG